MQAHAPLPCPFSATQRRYIELDSTDWSMEAHARYPPQLRATFREVLLCVKRCSTVPLTAEAERAWARRRHEALTQQAAGLQQFALAAEREPSPAGALQLAAMASELAAAAKELAEREELLASGLGRLLAGLPAEVLLNVLRLAAKPVVAWVLAGAAASTAGAGPSAQ